LNQFFKDYQSGIILLNALNKSNMYVP